MGFINPSTAYLPRVKGLSVALGPREYECGSLDIVSSNLLRKSFLLARSLLFLENKLHGPGGFPANLVLSGFCVGEGSYCLTWRWRSLGDHENYRWLFFGDSCSALKAPKRIAFYWKQWSVFESCLNLNVIGSYLRFSYQIGILRSIRYGAMLFFWIRENKEFLHLASPMPYLGIIADRFE